MHFNLFDIILVTIFVASTLLGMYRGLVVTSINIGSFMLTIFLTIVLVPLSKEIVSEHVSNDLVVTIISLVISYLLARFSSNWLAKRLEEITDKYTKGVIDRSLGLWIGAIRGYVICLSLFMIAAIFTSSSYVGAKNYWQIIHHIDSKEYPKWLKKGTLFDIMQGSYIGANKFFSGTIVETYLEGLNMPAKQVETSGTVEAINEVIDEKDASNTMDELQKQLLNTHETEKPSK